MTHSSEMTQAAVRIEEFPESELGAALAARVAEDLVNAIRDRGHASLAVPGGTTPVAFLRALGRIDLPWDRVTATLTDERWVPTDNARSNQRTLAETLFQGRAAAARFVPLYSCANEPALGLPAVAAALEEALPLDVCVLGMGNDMHTASLFPDSPDLARALAPEDGAPVLAVTAPGAPEPRITLTGPVLAGAARLYLLIRGTAKRAALAQAIATGDPQRAPIRAILDAAAAPLVFYAD